MLLAACPQFSHAHQALETGLPQSFGEIAPPLKGSREFLESAPSLLRPRCDADRSELLDQVERMLRDERSVRWGVVKGIDPRAAEYLRSKAEESVLELIESTPDLLEIDTINLGAIDSPFFRVEHDPQHSSLLFKVTSGEGPTELSVVEWDLTGEAFDRTTELVVAPQGTTYALVRLVSTPAEETTFRFSIRRRGETEPATWRGVDLRSPPWGHLDISLLNHEGEPCPALLSIRSVEGGVYRQPAGAVDLRTQLNEIIGPPISEPGKGYFFFLPGKKRGRYWIAPSNVEMTLPVGEWEVRVLRGPEQQPVVDTVSVRKDEWTRRSYKIARWTDLRTKGWWSGDDHIHARLMHGEDAKRLLDYVQAVDLHVANILEMGDAYRTYYAQRGFGREFRVSRNNHWLVPGQEDPRSDLGHAIGLNLDAKVRDLELYLQNQLLADRIHEGGGLYGHTHVGADACFVHREMALFTPLGIVDFNSVMQANLGTELFYDFLNLGYKMTATAGTIGSTRVYADTGDTEKLDPDEWFDAVKRGNTFVSNGPMLDFTVNGQLPGSTIELPPGGTLDIQASVEGLPNWSSPETLEIICLGEVLRQSASDDSNNPSLEVSAQLRPEHGCWIAAKSIGHDGSEAHTTPVYVSVGGDRHWNREAAPAIIKRQLEVLHEIEDMLAQSERLVASRTQLLDRGSQINASQADAVREQVAKTRAIYQQLLEEAAAPEGR